MKTKLQSIQNAIDIWPIQISDHSGDLENCRAILTQSEQDRAANFVKQSDSNRFVICRSLLRRVLANYLDEDPKFIQFKRNEHGKPFLENSPLNFNLSHSRDRMLLAVTEGCAVGVDIEFERDSIKMDAIAKRWFAPDERTFFQEADTPYQAFFQVWSKKEAYVKALGQGIFHDLQSFTVPLGEKQNTPSLEKSGQWFFQTLDIAPNYAAAVVSETPVKPIRIIQSSTSQLTQV